MKLPVLLFLGILAVSCSETNDNNSSESKEQHQEAAVNSVDSSETVIEEVSESLPESKFEYFEDYLVFDTKEALVAAFDADDLEDGISWYAEGTVQMPHTILHNKMDGHIIKFVWKEENPNELNLIEAYYNIYDEDYEITGTQTLKSDCGMELGMSISELKAWNGADFNFSGFGWDYQGGIHTNSGGKFAECQTIGHLDCSTYSDESTFLLGDVTLNTSDNKVLEAPIFLSDFAYYLP